MIDTSKKINIINTYRQPVHNGHNDSYKLLKRTQIDILRQPRPESVSPLANLTPDNLALKVIMLSTLGVTLPKNEKHSKSRH